MIDLPERIRVAAGHTIYSVGDQGDRAFLLLSGRVELRSPAGPAGREAGEVFGELALIDDGPREATAVAVSDCVLLGFSSSELSPAIAQLPPMLRIALGSVVARHSEMATAMRRAAGQDGRPAVLPLWTERIDSARKVVAFEHELRSGLARGELELFFQPIVRLMSGRLAGFEALVRWRHPAKGLLLPGEFIPMAEAAGLIGEITSFCLQEVGRCFPALRSAASGNRAAAEHLFVSVNVTAADLAQNAFAARTVLLLEEGGVEPGEVRLEITESILMTDPEQCARTMRNCRDQGFLLAIDDFGTGYSSLHLLSTLPLSILKVDRSFCAAAAASEAGRKVIAAILRLGHDLSLQVIAEGVETREQADMLRAMACDLGQGFLFGGPLDFADALAFASGQRGAIAPAA